MMPKTITCTDCGTSWMTDQRHHCDEMMERLSREDMRAQGDYQELLLLEDVADAAAVWRALAQGALTIPLKAHLESVNALCAALDDLQNFREAHP